MRESGGRSLRSSRYVSSTPWEDTKCTDTTEREGHAYVDTSILTHYFEPNNTKGGKEISEGCIEAFLNGTVTFEVELLKGVPVK